MIPLLACYKSAFHFIQPLKSIEFNSTSDDWKNVSWQNVDTLRRFQCLNFNKRHHGRTTNLELVTLKGHINNLRRVVTVVSDDVTNVALDELLSLLRAFVLLLPVTDGYMMDGVDRTCAFGGCSHTVLVRGLAAICQ
jgi:hypothetical protein